MHFKLHITCDNAAFSAGDDEGETADTNARNAEVARILRYVADRIELNRYGPAVDVNGNNVGSYGFFDEVYGVEAHVD